MNSSARPAGDWPHKLSDLPLGPLHPSRWKFTRLYLPNPPSRVSHLDPTCVAQSLLLLRGSDILLHCSCTGCIGHAQSSPGVLACTVSAHILANADL